MVTINDIAAESGVSPSTVSLVLNGKGRISPEVRERIFETARRLNYRKTTLPPMENKHITAILFPLHDTWAHVWFFIRNIIELLCMRMQETGYTQVLLPVEPNQDPEKLFETINSMNISSVYSIHYGNSILFSRLEQNAIPVVVINNSEYQTDFYSVCVDDFQGAYEAARYLIYSGHKRIAYIDYPRPSLPSIVSDRFIGFKKALDESKMDLPGPLRITLELNDNKGMKENITSLFSLEPPPDAIFIHDDFQASRCYHFIRELGLDIPGDVSIISPGDTLDYNMPENPPLSTMKIDTSLMAEYAFGMMKKRLDGEEAFTNHHTIKIRQTLHKRNSVAEI